MVHKAAIMTRLAVLPGHATDRMEIGPAPPAEKPFTLPAQLGRRYLAGLTAIDAFHAAATSEALLGRHNS